MIVVNSYETVNSESSSKGNQRKFYKDGIWVKIDSQRGSEGLAEEFVSYFESCIYDFNFVRYKSDIIYYNDDTYNGCYSYNMLEHGVEFVSLRSVLKSANVPFNIIIKYDDICQNINAVIDVCSSVIGLDLRKYLFRTLFLDALIINEDRHIMNLGVCFKDDKFYEAPCFDNGSSLFCTNWTYRKSKSFKDNIKSASSSARPFSKFYDKQLGACLDLGAEPLVIDKRKIDCLISNYYNRLYSAELNNRVKSVLVNRLQYYEGRIFRYV